MTHYQKIAVLSLRVIAVVGMFGSFVGIVYALLSQLPAFGVSVPITPLIVSFLANLILLGISTPVGSAIAEDI